MSVIVTDLITSKTYLFSKGADEVMLSKSHLANTSPQSQELQDFESDIKKIAKEGFRTLVFGYRELDKEELQLLLTELRSSSNLLAKERERSLAALYKNFEKEIKIVGFSGIEDELQEEVAECVQTFLSSGIKFWILTGDSLETAVNIAYSSSLLKEGDFLSCIYSIEDFEVLSTRLESTNSLNYRALYPRTTSTPSSRLAMAITGSVLHKINSNSTTRANFVLACSKIGLVIAARVSPGQKSELVTLVKRSLTRVRTLAVGDGANDVSMILNADIGVGIRGREGVQAARISDYSIAEFKHLKTLLLNYGNEFFVKNKNFVFFNFYKNLILIFPTIL